MSNVWSALEGGVVGIAVGTAGATVAEPAFEPARQQAWKESQARILELRDLATLVAQALQSVDEVLDDAERNGYHRDQLLASIQLALKAPGPAEAEKLYLRAKGGYPGAITRELLDHAYAKAGIEYRYWDALTQAAQNQLMTPAQLALGVVRSTLKDPGLLVTTLDTSDSNVPLYTPAALDVLDEAAAAGVNEERMRALVGSIGLPLAAIAAAQAHFRGILTLGGYNQAILEGDTRPEWAPFILDYARQILTAHDGVELRLRGWVNDDAMYALTARHGMSRDDTDLLFKVLGRPIPTHQVTTGLARGGTYNGPIANIPESYLRSLEESNQRPEWYSLSYANRYSLPGAFVIRALLKDGALSEAEGEQLFLEEAWPPELAKKVATYYAQQAPKPVDPHVKSATTAAITATRNSFAKGKITETQAVQNLSDLGLDPAVQTSVLAAWQIEARLLQQEADTAGLTPH